MSLSIDKSGVQASGEGGYQRLLVGLSNTGNVMLKPYGTLQVSNTEGQTVGNFTLKLDTFLPQTNIDYPVAITGTALGAGEYQAILNLKYGQGQLLHYSTKFTISQQQVTQVFGSRQTQPLSGSSGAVFAGMPLWQLVLVAGCVLAILCMAGSTVYKRLAVSRAKQVNSRSSQFKKPVLK